MEQAAQPEKVCRTEVIHVRELKSIFTFRWLKVFHVSLASERKQRTLAGEVVGDITAEIGPFTSLQMEGEKRYGKPHLSTFPT